MVVVAFLAMSLASNFLPATNTHAQTKTATTVEQCQGLLNASRKQTYAEHLVLPKRLTLLSWNIYKAQKEHLHDDLTRLNKLADIVLLQEAIDVPFLHSLKPYWRFSKGYKSGDMQSGVMTLSRWPAVVHCTLTHTEPWLRSPKATNIVEYALPNQQSLLSINLHGINFALGTEDFAVQFSNAASLMKNHTGPIVFAGDFNAWSDARQEIVVSTLTKFGLKEAKFADDQRTTAFGLALDQLWSRDIKMTDATVLEYSSSDHNPILINLTLLESHDDT